MIDVLELVHSEVRVTEGPHKDKIGRVVALKFDTKTTPLSEVTPESIIVDMISDYQKFSAPIIWLEIVKEP